MTDDQAHLALRTDRAIARILEAEGVRTLIAYPVNPLIEAAAERDIRTVIVRQERTGLHMADAMSRVTAGEAIGVFAMQHGPGAENAYGGIAQAFSESIPILVLPAGYPRRYSRHAPNYNASVEMRGITKSCEPLLSGRQTEEVLRRAFTQLRNGRPGPALVEIPLDVFGEETRAPDGYRPSRRHRVGPDPDDVVAAAKALAAAERPVLYAGQGVHWARAWPELRELAERLSVPVTTSIGGKSAFPEDHELALGCAGRSISGPAAELLADADLIFGIGCSFSWTFFGQDLRAQQRRADGRSATIVHSTLDPLDVHKDLAADLVVLGDAQLVLRALLDELDGPPPATAQARDGEVESRIADLRHRWVETWRPKLESASTPISPYRVITELRRMVDPADVVITHDAGSPRDQLTPFWLATEPLSYLGWGKTTQLGYGLGLALGAKLAKPEKICINVWGDAAIGFTGTDLETAAREKLPILSILFNNESMAIEIPIMPISTEKYRATDIGGRYADFARSLGCHGERVEDPEEIVPALRRGIEATMAGEPALLEFMTAQELEISTGMER